MILPIRTSHRFDVETRVGIGRRLSENGVRTPAGHDGTIDSWDEPYSSPNDEPIHPRPQVLVHPKRDLRLPFGKLAVCYVCELENHHVFLFRKLFLWPCSIAGLGSSMGNPGIRRVLQKGMAIIVLFDQLEYVSYGISAWWFGTMEFYGFPFSNIFQRGRYTTNQI